MSQKKLGQLDSVMILGGGHFLARPLINTFLNQEIKAIVVISGPGSSFKPYTEEKKSNSKVKIISVEIDFTKLSSAETLSDIFLTQQISKVVYLSDLTLFKRSKSVNRGAFWKNFSQASELKALTPALSQCVVFAKSLELIQNKGQKTPSLVWLSLFKNIQQFEGNHLSQNGVTSGTLLESYYEHLSLSHSAAQEKKVIQVPFIKGELSLEKEYSNLSIDPLTNYFFSSYKMLPWVYPLFPAKQQAIWIPMKEVIREITSLSWNSDLHYEELDLWNISQTTKLRQLQKEAVSFCEIENKKQKWPLFWPFNIFVYWIDLFLFRFRFKSRIDLKELRQLKLIS